MLDAVGKALDFERNRHVREAYEAGLVATNYPASMLAQSYVTLPYVFAREYVREMAESTVGIDYLDGWVAPAPARRARAARARLRRAHAARAGGKRRPGLGDHAHPQRDHAQRRDRQGPVERPLTAIAIARTLADVAPDHPLTRHLAVAYWKGGDVSVEERLYRPRARSRRSSPGAASPRSST